MPSVTAERKGKGQVFNAAQCLQHKMWTHEGPTTQEAVTPRTQGSSVSEMLGPRSFLACQDELQDGGGEDK